MTHVATNTAGLNSEALDQLKHDQQAILDAIDKLRSLGVGKLVHLPQIVVVGDESSGKSSVLEAISRVRFPVNSGICTRFPTELVLRPKPTEEFKVKLRSASDVDLQHSFEETGVDKNDIPSLIEKARNIIGLEKSRTGFSEDTLRIEISGPDLLPLTLVDLPGFYHAGTSQQSEEGIPVVRRLAEKYMRQRNSIILAIVSAKSAISQQTVLEEIRRHDPKKERTLGIITKVDTLESEVEEEKRYVRLAKNQETPNTLKHGWHVLRNRTSEENDERGSGKGRISDNERDEKETQFLTSGVWSSIPASDKGVGALRRKLSRILTDHVHSNMPSVIQDIDSNLEHRQNRLNALGPPRRSLVEMRQYLDNVFNQFRDITTAATKGVYEGDFFIDEKSSHVMDGMLESDPRKLRAVVRNLNRAFTTLVTVHGSKFRIMDYKGLQTIGEDRKIPHILELWIQKYQVDKPQEVGWLDIKARLEVLASSNQGDQLPGSPNDKLALELFRERSSRWEEIAMRHVELTTGATRHFIDLVLQHIIPVDKSGQDAILAEYIDPFFESRSEDLQDKIKELLRHYQHGTIVGLEDEFLEQFDQRVKARMTYKLDDSNTAENATPKRLFNFPSANVENSANKETMAEPEPNSFGLEHIIDMMNTYYEISLRTFVDNVLILAVENCLVARLPSILSSNLIYGMTEEALLRLAGETPETERERASIAHEIDLLKTGLQICKRCLPRTTLVTDPVGSKLGEDVTNSRSLTVVRRPIPTPTTENLARESSQPSSSKETSVKLSTTTATDTSKSQSGQPGLIQQILSKAAQDLSGGQPTGPPVFANSLPSSQKRLPDINHGPSNPPIAEPSQSRDEIRVGRQTEQAQGFPKPSASRDLPFSLNIAAPLSSHDQTTG